MSELPGWEMDGLAELGTRAYWLWDQRIQLIRRTTTKTALEDDGDMGGTVWGRTW